MCADPDAAAQFHQWVGLAVAERTSVLTKSDPSVEAHFGAVRRLPAGIEPRGSDIPVRHSVPGESEHRTLASLTLGGPKIAGTECLTWLVPGPGLMKTVWELLGFERVAEIGIVSRFNASFGGSFPIPGADLPPW